MGVGHLGLPGRAGTAALDLGADQAGYFGVRATSAARRRSGAASRISSGAAGPASAIQR